MALSIIVLKHVFKGDRDWDELVALMTELEKKRNITEEDLR